MLQIHLVLPLIGLPRRPSIDSPAMHLAFEPVALIDAAICHVERSFAMKDAIFYIASIHFSSVADILAFALLYTIHILSIIRTAISPGLFALAMRLIHLPVSLILLVISILKHPIAVGMIFHPLSFIGIPIDVAKLPIPPSSISLPIAFILRLVWPNLSPSSLSLIVDNVAIIDSSVSKLDHLPPTLSRWQLLIDEFELIEIVLVVELVIVVFFEYGGCVLDVFFFVYVFGLEDEYFVSRLIIVLDVVAHFTGITHSLQL